MKQVKCHLFLFLFQVSECKCRCGDGIQSINGSSDPVSIMGSGSTVGRNKKIMRKTIREVETPNPNIQLLRPCPYLFSYSNPVDPSFQSEECCKRR